MKNIKTPLFRVLGLLSALGLTFSSVSCMTTYDAQGNPMTAVDPGAAVAGAAAAGIIGLALGSSSGHHGGHRGHSNVSYSTGVSYGSPYYSSPYRSRSGHCAPVQRYYSQPYYDYGY